VKITMAWLEEKDACSGGREWWDKNGREASPKKIILALLASTETEKYPWANWLIARVFTRRQCIQYAVFAARQVLHYWEEKYPNDLRPQQAIEAAEKVLKKNTEKNRAEAAEAAEAARAAWAAEAAGAAGAARAAMYEKIIRYGLTLLK
jgi:hypothetical protein